MKYQSDGEWDSSNLETQKIAKCLGTHLEERTEDIYLIQEN